MNQSNTENIVRSAYAPAVSGEKGTPLKSDRAALSPEEFAAYFGRSKTWAYRRIYAGDIKVISSAGRMMIPVDQIDTLLRSAAIYRGASR